MIGIVVSRADRASSHIGEHLRDLADWTVEEDDTRAEGDGGGTVLRTTGFELRAFDTLHLEIEGWPTPSTTRTSWCSPRNTPATPDGF